MKALNIESASNSFLESIKNPSPSSSLLSLLLMFTKTPVACCRLIIARHSSPQYIMDIQCSKSEPKAVSDALMRTSAAEPVRRDLLEDIESPLARSDEGVEARADLVVDLATAGVVRGVHSCETDLVVGP